MKFSDLPLCPYRKGVVEHGKARLKCKQRGCIVDAKDCLICFKLQPKLSKHLNDEKTILRYHVETLLKMKGLDEDGLVDKIVEHALKEWQSCHNIRIRACLTVLEFFPFHYTIRGLASYAGVTDAYLRYKVRRGELLRKKVLDVLDDEWVTTEEVVEKLKLPRKKTPLVRRILRILWDEGLVERGRKVGRTYEWRRCRA